LEGKPATEKQKYLITSPVMGDAGLHQALLENLLRAGAPAHNGLSIASDTFFACQGRQDSHFDNFDAVDILQTAAKYSVDTMEMTSFTLYQLAKHRTIAPLHAAACHIGILNRVNPAMTENIRTAQFNDVVMKCGSSALDALIGTKL